MKNNKISAIVFAFLAAVFYAVNVPFSKLLLTQLEPKMLASFLYLGAGTGVGILYLFNFRKEDKSERLTRKDLPFTIGMILLDIAAPVFLMTGINLGSASSASLLGNFEIAATALIALLVFKEKISLRLWFAILFITLSCIELSLEGHGSLDVSLGSVFVLLAAVSWGFENNCTRKISGKSTYEIVTLKGIFSGLGALVIALLMGEKFSSAVYILYALLLGFVSYGLSIFLYIRAQRTLGAAKTSAYYAVAPFIGTFLSFLLNGEKLSVNYFLGLGLMIVGSAFAVTDTLLKEHSHLHTHTIIHTHDGTTHSHVIAHEHEHSHFVTEEKHEHSHEDFMNSEEHLRMHRNSGEEND